MTYPEMKTRVEELRRECEEIRRWRHRQQWPIGHSEDPGYVPRLSGPRRRSDWVSADYDLELGVPP